MTIFLQILGGIFLVLLVLVLAAGLFIWYKSRTIGTSAGMPPPFVHLYDDPEPEWVQAENIQEEIRSLEASGFSWVGTFRIREMPAFSLAAMIWPEKSLIAVVYLHETLGCWTDIGLEYADGSDLTVTSAPIGSEMDTRPEAKKIFEPGKTAAELLELLNAEKGEGPYVTVTQENFQELFEASYARDAGWRIEKGGISRDEIRRVAKGMKRNFSDNMLEKAWETSQEDYLEQLHQECIRRFVMETRMSVADWERYRNTVFIVTDRVKSERLLPYWDEYLDFDKRQIARLDIAALPVRQLFNTLNNSLPEEFRAERIGSVVRPVPADIYAVETEPDDF